MAGVDYNTYLYYMQIKDEVSLPSQQKWTPYTDETVELILDDYQRLWDTGFLNDLWVEVIDTPYDNGVPAKTVIFNMEERERVKIVTYEGSEVLKTEDILENLEQQGVTLRMDSFVDPETIRRVKAIVRQGFQAQGYMFAEVDHTIEELPGGPKLVRLTFHLTEGPKVQVHEIDFIGNEAMSDGRLRGKMKKIKQRWWLSLDDRTRHLQARGVRRGRGGDRGVLPGRGLHHGAGGPAGAGLPRSLRRRRDPRAASPDPGR